MLVTQYFTRDLYRGKTVFVTGGGSGINLGVAKNWRVGTDVADVVFEQRDATLNIGEVLTLSVKQVVDHDKILTTQHVTARYVVVLTPSETRWRVRVLQAVTE